MKNYQPSIGFSIALILGFLSIGTAVGAPHLTAPEAVAFEEHKSLVHGPNVPGGVAFLGETDTHTIHLGWEETCVTESWLLPIEYKTVADFRYDNPEAKPDSLTPVTDPSDYSLCDKNGQYKNSSLETQRIDTYGQPTGVRSKLEANDLIL